MGAMAVTMALFISVGRGGPMGGPMGGGPSEYQESFKHVFNSLNYHIA